MDITFYKYKLYYYKLYSGTSALPFNPLMDLLPIYCLLHARGACTAYFPFLFSWMWWPQLFSHQLQHSLLLPSLMHQKSKTWLGSNQSKSPLWAEGMAVPDKCVLLLFPVFGVLQAVPIRNRQCWWSCVTLWWAPVCSQGMFPFPWAEQGWGCRSFLTPLTQCPVPGMFSSLCLFCALGDASLLPFLAVSPWFCLSFPPKEASELFAPVCAGRLLPMDYWHSSLGYFSRRECGFFSANGITRANPTGGNNLSDLVPDHCTLLQVSP